MTKCISCGSENVKTELKYRCDSCGGVSTREELDLSEPAVDPQELDYTGEGSAYDDRGNLYFLDDHGKIFETEVTALCPSCRSASTFQLCGASECLDCGKTFGEKDRFEHFKEKYSSSKPSLST